MKYFSGRMAPRGRGAARLGTEPRRYCRGCFITVGSPVLRNAISARGNEARVRVSPSLSKNNSAMRLAVVPEQIDETRESYEQDLSKG
jgi:hypothetical protein